jgi:hypothetical protein
VCFTPSTLSVVTGAVDCPPYRHTMMSIYHPFHATITTTTTTTTTTAAAAAAAAAAAIQHYITTTTTAFTTTTTATQRHSQPPTQLTYIHLHRTGSTLFPTPCNHGRAPSDLWHTCERQWSSRSCRRLARTARSCACTATHTSSSLPFLAKACSQTVWALWLEWRERVLLC